VSGKRVCAALGVVGLETVLLAASVVGGGAGGREEGGGRADRGGRRLGVRGTAPRVFLSQPRTGPTDVLVLVRDFHARLDGFHPIKPCSAPRDQHGGQTCGVRVYRTAYANGRR
jgi:hypothetical protein